MTVMDNPPTQSTTVPELETVDRDGHLPTSTSYTISVDDDATNAILAEREFLTALLWAPPETTRAVLAAILGSPTPAATADTDTRITDRSALLLHPTHRILFSAIADMVNEGQPITPALVLARADADSTTRRHRQLVRALLVDLTAPSGYAHPHHGLILPRLASALVEAWYRRGYIRFIDRMRQGMTELPTHELASMRDDLVAMSRAADTRMLAITDRLARI